MKKFDYWLQRAGEWSANYRKTVASRKVCANIKFGDVLAKLPKSPPEHGEPMEEIFTDFEKLIPDNMTHWQHPRFFAYFQSNSAASAQIGEQLANAMSAQCMLWQTSPAATELEIRMVEWLCQAFGLPIGSSGGSSGGFKGVFQDTASAATLAAILVMRERALDFKGNREGLFGKNVLRIYANEQNHSSIEKAMWIAGLGSENLVSLKGSGKNYGMNITELKEAIEADKKNGLKSAGIIGCVGGTGVGAIDNIESICKIAKKENLYVHVDAAWAGSAMVCPEYRHLWKGIEAADSIVINPHKWLGVPLECSLHLIKDEKQLQKTLAISPSYLQDAGGEQHVNFSEWSLTLGRRFRALKVWFLLRHEGLESLRTMIRNHISWSQELAKRLENESDFEITTKPILSLFTFRHIPKDKSIDIDKHNLSLVKKINKEGTIYLTQGNFKKTPTIRLVIGQFEATQKDINTAFKVITELARK